MLLIFKRSATLVMLVCYQKFSKSSNCSIAMEQDPIMALTWSHDMNCTCKECYAGPWRHSIIYYKFNQTKRFALIESWCELLLLYNYIIKGFISVWYCMLVAFWKSIFFLRRIYPALVLQFGCCHFLENIMRPRTYGSATCYLMEAPPGSRRISLARRST